MCVYAQVFGLVASVVLFVLISTLEVGFVGVLFELQILLVHRSWHDDFYFLYLFFCVKLIWELNPNRAKSLEFGMFKKYKRKAPNLITRGPALLFFSFLFSSFPFLSPFSLSLFLFLYEYPTSIVAVIVAKATIGAIAESLEFWVAWLVAPIHQGGGC